MLENLNRNTCRYKQLKRKRDDIRKILTYEVREKRS